ncbi:hypothetical protein [Spirosoma gilvum]
MNQPDEYASHAKRKRYEPQTYARLLAELTQAMEEVPKLRPDRDAWDIEGDWAATGTIYFVDAVHQALFEPLHHFDCRTIKLVNLDQPAVRLTFYRKHRYWLLKDKDLPLAEKIAQIQTYINDLVVKSQALAQKQAGLSAPKQTEAKRTIGLYEQQIQQWQEVLAMPERYEMALSNYARQHMYVTVNYKYRLASGDYANAQEHLLNTQRDRLGNITQNRYNILFVDPVEILREHPYQNREVEGYLANFSIQSEVGKHTIYARLRPDTNSLDLFK